MINPNALRHPSTQWNIEAGLWRALEYGAAIVQNRAGGEIVTIVHDRSAIPAFSFWKGYEDVSVEFLRVLRA